MFARPGSLLRLVILLSALALVGSIIDRSLATSGKAPPALSAKPNAGLPGASLEVRGAKFPGNTAVTLRWDGAALSAAQTTAQGDFGAIVKVPANAPTGSHMLTAYVGQASASAAVVVAGALAAAQAPPPTGTPLVLPSPSPTEIPLPTPGATATPAPTSTPAPTAAPAPTGVPAPRTFTVYADRLAPWWEDWSWSTSVNLAATEPVRTGSSAIAFAYGDAWACLNLHTPGLRTAGFSTLTFYLNGGGNSGQAVQVALYGPSAKPLTPARRIIGAYIEKGAVAAGEWRRVSIPLADLGGTDTIITGIAIQDTAGGAQPTLYLDDLQLVAD